MDQQHEIIAALERIATALERLADSKTPRKPRTVNTENPVYAEILQALNDYRDDLTGRMELQEIAFAINVDLTRSNQAAFGSALTAFGARKGRSGSKRFYEFD